MRFRKACLPASILFSTVALGQHTSIPKNWDPNMTMTNEEVRQPHGHHGARVRFRYHGWTLTSVRHRSRGFGIPCGKRAIFARLGEFTDSCAGGAFLPL